jgi:hypothetical protein
LYSISERDRSYPKENGVFLATVSTAMTDAFEPEPTTTGVTSAGVVDSMQRTALTRPLVTFDEDGPRQLAATYWASVRRATRGLVRPRKRAGGVDLVLLGVVPLLRFGAPREQVAEDRVAASFPITGGLLAVTPGGWLALEQRADPSPGLSISVIGYHARLARHSPRLYARIQSRAHLAVSRLFFRPDGGEPE